MTTGRVAIFIDGKNFYEGLRASNTISRVDFREMAEYIAKEVGGGVVTGLHYYTAIMPRKPEEGDDTAPGRGKGTLEGFLHFLETQQGCFVHRFNRKTRSVQCSECGNTHYYSEEKEVDTSLVASMIQLAAADAFDIGVLCSGDADHTPALVAMRNLGKPAWVGTFGGHGLSRRLRQEAYGHIDLSIILPSENVEYDVVAAVSEAQEYFGGERYVGLNMFVARWRSQHLPQIYDERQALVQEAIDTGAVEIYEAEDGNKAIRITPAS